MNQAEKTSEILKKRKLKPSYQRIRIYEYLATNFIHPTADQVFDSLKDQIPTLSKSTVYSSLKSFVNAGLLREVTIEDNEVRYEFNLKNHGHFKCEKCGIIYDFGADIDSLGVDGLDGFQIKSKDVYFKGICNKCRKTKTAG